MKWLSCPGGAGPLLLSVVLVIASLGGCSLTVQTTMENPAIYPEAANLRRVAFIGFEGKYAREVDASFETMLVNHQFEGRPYFTVVDRSRSQVLMREHKLSLSRVIDPSTAIRFGKVIGVSGFYFGDIKNVSFTTDSLNSTETYCKQYSSNGKKCKDYGTRRVVCRERTVNLTLVPGLLDAETGQIVYRAERIGRSSSVACPGSGGKPDSSLVAEAIAQAVSLVRTDIAPTTRLVNVTLMEKPSTLTGRYAEEFYNGLAFSKAKRMDRACGIWRDLNQRVQAADNALLYNVAVCEELDGQLEESLKKYRLVDSRLTSPDRHVNEALNRVQSNLATY